MRRMEEEVEYVGPREDFLSEDDHSPTDASEDSVEVKVTPIKTHYRHPLTRPIASAGTAAHHLHHHLHHHNLSLPLKVPSHHRPLSPPIHKIYHNFRKHFPAAVIPKEEYDLKAPRSPEDYNLEGRHHQSSSPQDFSSSSSRLSPPPSHYDTEIKHSPLNFTAATTVRSPIGVISPPIPAVIRPSPSASPVEPPMGAAPLSPGTRAAARSRRKPAEPRRLCHEGFHNNNNNTNHNNNNKRSHSPDPPRKCAKFPRTENSNNDDKSVGSSPSPGAPNLLAHHPFLGSLGRPPMGVFPPLLLPPAWPPVATQWGYPRVVTPLGWAGLAPGLTPHPYPMLLPNPYPLSRPLLHPHLHPASPPPKSPPPRPPSEEQLHQARDELPIPLVTRVPPPPSDPPSTSSSTSSASTPHHHLHSPHPLSHPHHLLHHHHHHPHPHPAAREVSVVKKIGKAPSKFLSVESLIASDSPSSSRPEAAAAAAVVAAAAAALAAAEASGADLDDDMLQMASLAGDDDDDDDTIHSLLQPNKQKQRNYKNMTRERRIEANARERNRVHTISAAFEKLRTSVPAYSHNQKLSKLSVLRIACSYIMLLSRLAGHDYSEEANEPSISDCVDLTTRTIQVEGKAKKKRDE